MLTLREMRAEDVDTLVSWLVTLPLMQRYRLRPDVARRQFMTALDQPQNWLIVADIEPDHPACGFAWAILDGAFGRSVYLRLIAVRPDHTDAGIGSALLKAIEQRAAAASRDLLLLTSGFNSSAQRFYIRHGYRQVGAIPDYVIPGITEYIYWKPQKDLKP